jgi:hypothetical protein
MSTDTSSMGLALCRYLLYDNPERTQAWRLDVENDGKAARFYVNGEAVSVPRENEVAVLQALSALDTAFGDLMLASDRIEDEKRIDSI